MKDLYTGNYKTLLKGIKGGTDKQKDIPYSWTAGLNIVQMSMLPKVLYRFDGTTIKKQKPKTLEFTWNKEKVTENHRNTLKIKKVRGITF